MGRDCNSKGQMWDVIHEHRQRLDVNTELQTMSRRVTWKLTMGNCTNTARCPHMLSQRLTTDRHLLCPTGDRHTCRPKPWLPTYCIQSSTDCLTSKAGLFLSLLTFFSNSLSICLSTYSTFYIIKSLVTFTGYFPSYPTAHISGTFLVQPLLT
jgi:hypothetical protein